ncbi:MAG TPA: hypothetical protein VEC99_18350 [Clostridia bacterium]|nr:hypothetical protein [Clostridia bacterium]
MITLEELTPVYWERYRESASKAAKLSLLLDRDKRLNLIYEWIKSGKVGIKTFKMMIEDFT